MQEPSGFNSARPSVAEFVTSFVHNVAALMSGALSVPFAYWGLFRAPDDQKSLFIVLACFAIVVASFSMWFKERQQVLTLRDKLSKLGAKLSLDYKDAQIHFDLGNSQAYVVIIFENVGDDMLVYELEEIMFAVNGTSISLPPGNSRTYIQSKGTMQFHFTVTGLPQISPANAINIKLGFTANYDNVEPLRKRYLTRHMDIDYVGLLPAAIANPPTIIKADSGYLN